MKTIYLMIMAIFLFSCSTERSDRRSYHQAADADATASQGKKNPHAKDTRDSNDNTTPHDPSGVDLPEDEDIAMRDLTPNVGVRNLDQIRYSMANVTGISAQNANIRVAFEELRTQLPDNNDVRTVTPAKLSAITKLGAQFCDETMRNQQARSQLLPGINFSASPSQALSNPTAAAQMLIDGFWGTDLEKRADAASDVDILSTLIADLIREQPNNAQATANVLMGACTAVISSAPFILF